MKFKHKVPWPVAIIALAMGFSAVPLQAQWTVFDPTSYVMFGKIWSEDVSTGIKMAQTVQQGQQLISQGLNIYNLAQRETTALRNKPFMQAAGYLSSLPPIPGHPTWSVALKSGTGVANAANTWSQMTSPNMSLQSRIQLADSFGASMIDAAGGCSAAAVQNNGAIGALENITQSVATLDNTHAALAGASNAALTQQLRTQQCQHTLQLQQNQAHMLQMMRQRDYENAQATTYTHIDAVALSNPMGLANVNNTLLADIP